MVWLIMLAPSRYSCEEIDIFGSNMTKLQRKERSTASSDPKFNQVAINTVL